MKILNEKGIELNQEGLDYNLGYLTKSGDATYVYHLFNERQLAERKIPELKAKLAETDYQAIKFAEGELTEVEYEPMKIQRKIWREEIRSLEKEIKNIL